ncbi:hypothetical protein F4778DRAFT_652275 [Xylariomycetidae sp. FL2044]|nr:hypothetical protein F4778DRAFT_652275 [Xylariomycetidae sp. FL2044]
MAPSDFEGSLCSRYWRKPPPLILSSHALSGTRRSWSRHDITEPPKASSSKGSGVAMLSLASVSFVSVLPEIRDAILQGRAQPELCCPYGICKGNVVVAMELAQAQANEGSGLRYNTKQ